MNIFGIYTFVAYGQFVLVSFFLFFALELVTYILWNLRTHEGKWVLTLLGEKNSIRDCARSNQIKLIK